MCSSDLDVALMLRELKRRAQDEALDCIADAGILSAGACDEVHLLVVEELAEGIHRGDGNVAVEAELEKGDGVRSVVSGQVLMAHWDRDEGLRRSHLLLNVC